MALQNNKNRLLVDYLHEEKERERLITFLRDENLRGLSGEGVLNRKIKRRRTILILIAAALFLTGIVFVFR